MGFSVGWWWGWKKPGAEKDFCMDWEEVEMRRGFVGVVRGVTWTFAMLVVVGSSESSSSESEDSLESLSDSMSVGSPEERFMEELGLSGDMRPVEVLRAVRRLWTVMRVTSVPTSSPQTCCRRFRTSERRSRSLSPRRGVIGGCCSRGVVDSGGDGVVVVFCSETIALPRLVVENTRSGRGFFLGLGLSSESVWRSSMRSMRPSFLLLAELDPESSEGDD